MGYGDHVRPLVHAIEEMTRERIALRGERDALRALPERWRRESAAWAEAQPLTNLHWAEGYEDGWDHAADLLDAALRRLDET